MYQTVTAIDDELMAQAGGAGSAYGTGGMASKLKAALRIFGSKSSNDLSKRKKSSNHF